MTDPNDQQPQEIDIAQLAHEVVALRRLVLSILVMALVCLTVLNLGVFFTIPRFDLMFRDMMAGRLLPPATLVTLWIGSSPAALFVLVLLPIGSMVWLWLERERPANPVFAMFCLCVMMVVFPIWTLLTLILPLKGIILGP